MFQHTHHVARYVNNPKKERGDAVKYVGRYLAGTMDKGYVMTPDPSKGVEIYVDASFCQDWDPSLAGQDIDTARSRYGYIITYVGVPLVWKSSLATEVCLSTTEAELVGLLQYPLYESPDSRMTHDSRLHSVTNSMFRPSHTSYHDKTLYGAAVL